MNSVDSIPNVQHADLKCDSMAPKEDPRFLVGVQILAKFCKRLELES
jgi:hypothetical protein